MKKIFALSILVLALFAFVNTAKSQTMYFCESVDGSGYPVGESSTFNIGSNGGYLEVLVRLPYELSCRSVSYEIYRNGTYDNTIYQDTQRDWVWFKNQITFYKSGTYLIYAVDCQGTTLASGTLKIQIR